MCFFPDPDVAVTAIRHAVDSIVRDEDRPLRKATVAAKKSDAHRTHHDFPPSVTLSGNDAILDYHGF